MMPQGQSQSRPMMQELTITEKTTNRRSFATLNAGKDSLYQPLSALAQPLPVTRVSQLPECPSYQSVPVIECPM